MKDVEIQDLEIKSDERGWLFELLRGEWLDKHKQFGQFHISIAYPGKVRGNHYHTRKIEWFCVPVGTGLLLLKDLETGEEEEIVMGENNLKTVKITPGVVHAIKNTGDKDMVLLVYASETFDPNDPDTVFQKILE
ncbi:MAG: WxcM-like domain-containing protein [Nitrospinaceae bacterium]